MKGMRRVAVRLVLRLAAGLALTTPGVAFAEPAEDKRPVRLDVHDFRIVERESGKTNYFSIVDDPKQPFIQARYLPSYETAVFGIRVPESVRGSAHYLQWTWRATTLPKDGSECIPGRGDSAASVYVTWKRGLRWYSLKYVWSTVDAVGSVCRRTRNPFVAQDTVVLESGGPLDTWVTETIDLRSEFRRHLKDGDLSADVPDFVGVGVMADGDQSHSASGADFADFVVRP
jgi:hypothetical protein